MWKPLIDAFGPVLGEDPVRAFHPHDDRIVCLGLHHGLDTSIGHDVVIDAWWTGLQPGAVVPTLPGRHRAASGGHGQLCA